MFDALYVSPHFDDAALSCGAQIWDRVQRGERVAVLTVCAAPPPASLSPFAAGLHTRWAPLGTFDRVAEDREALDRLGAVPLHGALLDCIYRRSPAGEWLYASETALFGPLSPWEAPLVDTLVAGFEAVALKSGAAIFFPRAIGNHVDHQLVQTAGKKWRQTGKYAGAFRYYADYPYAESVPGGEPVDVSPEAGRQKINALRAYRSQLSTFWPDEATLIRKVSQWVERTF